MLAKFDDTELDGFGVSSDIVYVDLRDKSPESFAEMIYSKINSFPENNPQDETVAKFFSFNKINYIVLLPIFTILCTIIWFLYVTSNKLPVESTKKMIVGNLHLPVFTAFSARVGNHLRSFKIQSFLSPTSSYVLPKDLVQFKNLYAMLQKNKLDRGESHAWNGDILGLKSWDLVTPNSKDENKVLTISVEPVKYYDFVVTHLKLKEIRVFDEKGREVSAWDKYVGNYEHIETPNKNLANYFGVSLTVITSDGFVILSKRSNRNAVVPKVMHVSIAEGTKFPDDTNNESGNSLYNTALRGAKEELCLTINEDQVEFLGLIYSTELAQFDVIGTVQINLKREEIIRIKNSGCQDQTFENEDIMFVSINPASIVEFIGNQQYWSPFALASLTQTLYYRFGYTKVNKEFLKINEGKPVNLENFVLIKQ